MRTTSGLNRHLEGVAGVPVATVSSQALAALARDGLVVSAGLIAKGWASSVGRVLRFCTRFHVW